MNIRDLYSSHLVVGGLLSLVLGIGNWTVGALESTKYQSLVRKTAQTGLENRISTYKECASPVFDQSGTVVGVVVGGDFVDARDGRGKQPSGTEANWVIVATAVRELLELTR